MKNFILLHGILCLAASSSLSAQENAPHISLEGHPYAVSAVAFFPNGTSLLSAGEDQTLKVWDIHRGEARSTWRGHTAQISAAALSQDGRIAISGDEDGVLRLWDAEKNKELAVLKKHPDEIQAVAISSDGSTAASASFDGTIILWDTQTQTHRTIEREGITHALAFSPDGKHLLTARQDKTLILWDVLSGEKTTLLKGHLNPVLTVSFFPDGKRALSGSRDNTIRLWEIPSGKTLALWKGHTSHVLTTAISPDGRYGATGGADNSVRIWDTSQGKTIRIFREHSAPIRALAFSSDSSQIAAAGEESRIRIWDIAPSPRPRLKALPKPSPYALFQDKNELGRLLFFDKRLSGDNSMHCASCHSPAHYFSDGKKLSDGYPNTLYFRNTPTLLDNSRRKNLYWDGRFSAAEIPSLIRDHISEAHFMNADGRLIVEKIKQAPGYIRAFKSIYNSEPSYSSILDALASFTRSLSGGENRFDQYIAGNKKSLTSAEKRGLTLFKGKAGCVSCHAGPDLTDDSFHNRRVPHNPEITETPRRHITMRRFFRMQGVEGYTKLKGDVGLYAVTRKIKDLGKFRTPSLRHVAHTPPYMHNGIFSTLEEVVAFENKSLTDAEIADITAFLQSLSGEKPSHQLPLLPEYALRSREGDSPSNEQTYFPSLYNLSAEKKTPPAPLPAVPIPPDNPMSSQKIALGKMLFFEPRLSGNGDIFCGACHAPEMGWGDNSDISQGYTGTLHWRNAQTILNAAYFSNLHWDGSQTSLEEQARSAITSNIAGNADPLMVEERLAQFPIYVKLFKEIFGVERPHFEGVLKAIAAFERSVPISPTTPFDQYLQGKKEALRPNQKRGLSLFKGKAACIRCHNGPLLSDQSFYALGVPRNSAFDTVAQRQIALRYQHAARGVSEEMFRRFHEDPGLYLTTRREDDIGRFRTPSLRELRHTAPYMHNGVFANLRQVVEFYNKGGGISSDGSPILEPLHLSEPEIADLLSFLDSLSAETVDFDYPRLPEFK